MRPPSIDDLINLSPKPYITKMNEVNFYLINGKAVCFNFTISGSNADQTTRKILNWLQKNGILCISPSLEVVKNQSILTHNIVIYESSHIHKSLNLLFENNLIKDDLYQSIINELFTFGLTYRHKFQVPK